MMGDKTLTGDKTRMEKCGLGIKREWEMMVNCLIRFNNARDVKQLYWILLKQMDTSIISQETCCHSLS